MIIKSMRLKNIRTYEEEEVKFPEGIILFEGGIGAGKSTLLLAIEFALFGIGNEKGTTLLSIGKNSGHVELTFEAGGKDVRVFRSLERNRRSAGTLHQGTMVPASVKQGECWVEVDGARTSYSPKEMKEHILKVLSYNEPGDPKAKSVIFRYAVYTPQEEMKEILSQPPDLRLQTIRKALRIEEYKIAMENARNIAAEMRRNAAFIRDGAKRLPEVKEEIKATEEELPRREAELRQVEKEVGGIQEEIEALKAELDRLHSEQLKYAKDAEDVQNIDMDLQNVRSQIAGRRADISKHKRRLEELHARIETLQQAKEPAMSEADVEMMLAQAKASLSEYDREIGKLKADVERMRTLVEGGFCPTCNRPIDGTEYGAHLHEALEKYEDAKKMRQATYDRIKELDDIKKTIINYENNKKELNALKENVTDTEDWIFDSEQRLSEAEDQEKKLLARRLKAIDAAKRYEEVKAEYEDCNQKIKDKERDSKRQLERKAKLEQEMATATVNMEHLRAEADRLEAELRRAERLSWYSEWLVKYFAAALERIELTVMNTVRREFEEEFSRWFSYLVEDPSKGVRIDEDFTPLVTQDSYEQELNNLSGGERTSLALAYRLALNRVVQRSSSIGADLLILDEPTDGFSKDQIGKLGDLLRELQLRQAVIVSHERELEGAVDHIFRIQKEGGKSRVYTATS